MKQFKVHVGYTSTGRNRWREFDYQWEACAFCNAYFNATGVVLTIISAR